MAKKFATLLLVVFIQGCDAPERQYEDYNLRTSADLTLTEANHPHGYGRNACFVCHLPGNIHRQNTLGDPLFDSAQDLVERYGLKSCAGCHGDNGVSP